MVKNNDGMACTKRVHVLENSYSDKGRPLEVTLNDLAMVRVDHSTRGWWKVQRKKGKKEKISYFYVT